MVDLFEKPLEGKRQPKPRPASAPRLLFQDVLGRAAGRKKPLKPRKKKAAFKPLEPVKLSDEYLSTIIDLKPWMVVSQTRDILLVSILRMKYAQADALSALSDYTQWLTETTLAYFDPTFFTFSNLPAASSLNPNPGQEFIANLLSANSYFKDVVQHESSGLEVFGLCPTTMCARGTLTASSRLSATSSRISVLGGSRLSSSRLTATQLPAEAKTFRTPKRKAALTLQETLSAAAFDTQTDTEILSEETSADELYAQELTNRDFSWALLPPPPETPETPTPLLPPPPSYNDTFFNLTSWRAPKRPASDKPPSLNQMYRAINKEIDDQIHLIQERFQIINSFLLNVPPLTDAEMDIVNRMMELSRDTRTAANDYDRALTDLVMIELNLT